MKKVLAGAALAAVMACGCATEVSASTITVTGVVSSRQDYGGLIDGSFFAVGAPVKIVFDAFSYDQSNPSKFMPGYVLITSGDNSVGDTDDYFDLGIINPHKLSTSFGFYGVQTSVYGLDTSLDGGFGLTATSLETLPSNIEQSVGPLYVTGSAGFSFAYRVSSPDGDAGYGVGLQFALQSLTVTGSISAVPLPAAAPMFGVALAALGLVGLGRASLRPKRFA